MTGSPPIVDVSSSVATQQSGALSHRLATQSAAAALQDASSSKPSAISSGLNSLDSALTGGAPPAHAGFQRGKVAEIWGPSGSGKTALAFQTASQAIKAGEAVLWIDTATELSATRLKSLQSSSDSLLYLSTPTLSHLLALLLHPPPSFMSEKTALLVIDDLNMLIDLEIPRQPFSNTNKTEPQKWQAGRRYAILGSLTNALNKLASLHDIAVILTTGCTSRMRSDSGLAAALSPGVGGSEWESGISSRIVMFRDFNGRFLGVQKCQGRNLTPLDPVGDIRTVIGFEMSADGGLKEHVIDLASSNAGSETTVLPKKVTPSPVKIVRKRTYEEVADSDEDADEYGWAETDDINTADIASTHQPAAEEVQDGS